MTTETNPSPAPEPQGAMPAPPQNGVQTQNQQGQHQGQGHRRRRRRRNKNKGPQQGGQQQNGTAQNGQSSQAPAHHQGQQKQKSGKRFFQKNPGNQASYNGNGFRSMPGNNGNGGGGGRRKNKGRRQQVFVGPMDHSYRAVNGNVADPASHQQQQQGEFRGTPHSGFYSEADFYPPVPMREDAPTRIYCFIEDLFFLAKIQEVSKKLGIKVAFVKPDKDEKDKDVLAKLTETSEADRPALILFDLNNASAKPLSFIPKVRAKLKRGTSIIGFLSHIQGDLKNKALEAGCDTVMPRATFSQNLPGLLRRYGIVDEAEDEHQAIQA